MTIIDGNSRRWKRQYTDGGINIEWFGAQQYPADCTAVVQATADWCKDNNDVSRVVRIPAGNWQWSSVTFTDCAPQGETPSRPIYGIADLTTQLGSKLIQSVGATGPMITLAGGTGGKGWNRCRNLSGFGRQNQNHIATKAITGVTSRTVFNVALADVPAQPSDYANFPFYGVCVFYDANGYRLGTGLVQTVDAGTGQITLLTGWDNYTGTTSANLTTAERVAFAPRATWTGDGLVRTDVSDSCMVSPPMILVASRSAEVGNIFGQDFHCGIVFQDTVTRLTGSFWFSNCQMAGIATRQIGSGADLEVANFLVIGGTQDDRNQAARTIAKNSESAMQSLCGFWGPPGRSRIGSFVAAETVHSVIDKGGSGVHFDYLFADKPLKEAIISYGGAWLGGTGSPVMRINELQVTTTSSTVPLSPVTACVTGSKVAVALIGVTGRVMDIGSISIDRFDSAYAGGDFAGITYITQPGAGATGYNEVTIGSVTSTRALVDPSIQSLGTTSYKALAPFGLRSGSPAVTQIYGARMTIGSDVGKTSGIGDNTDKQAYLLGAPYTFSEPDTVFLAYGASLTGRALYLGGGLSNAYPILDGYLRAGTSLAVGTDVNVASWSATGFKTLRARYVATLIATSGTTLTMTQNTDEVLIVNKTIGSTTQVVLPSSPSVGRIVTVKDGKGDAATNNITIVPSAGTIDGAASVVLNTNYDVARFLYNGTQWNVI